MRFAFNIFYGVFIGLLVVIGALFLISLAPTELGIQTKIVQSGSMEPSIPVGALIIIKPNDAYKIGDVITFGEDSGAAVPTTHRVLGMREADGSVFYTTKGDANEEGDAREVVARDVIGKVYISVPYAGFVLNFARQPLGFVLLIALPAALVILAEFAAILHEIMALWRRRGTVRKHARRSMRSARARRPYSVEYVRLFETDDVFIPVRIFEARARSSGHRPATLSSTLAVLAIMVLTWYGTSSTLSYFRDTELSSGNTFAAGTWATIEALMSGAGEVPVEIVPSEEEESIVEEGADEIIVEEEATEGGSVPQEESERMREEREERAERSDTTSPDPEIRIAERADEVTDEVASDEPSTPQ